MTLLELADVHQGYRGHPVIRGLDLTLERGAFGLLGPNGAGKSTLLRTLATVSAPQQGAIRLFEQEVRTRPQLRAARRRIGYLPQSFAYAPSFTVTDFVRHCAWLREVPRRRIGPESSAAIARVDLTDQAGTPLRKLSGGMLRRAGIAQALVGSPDLVILDEPTTGLDPQQRVRFRELLREVAERSCVILSTHLVEDIAHACSRIGVLYEGRLRFDGTAAELRAFGGEHDPGDSPLERGYSAALAADPLSPVNVTGSAR